MSDFDKLRAEEFARLDSAGHVYLDYTGSGLYPRSALAHQDALLQRNVYGNPHSSNPTSKRSTNNVDTTRAAILRFFNADPSRYAVIFTANASAAVKLVAESFPFTSRSTLLLFTDNHNSVNGIRTYARQAQATVTYIPLDSRLGAPDLGPYLHDHSKHASNLFAFPAQSNFSGVKHDLAAVRAAHRRGWFVLLDAAAFVPTSKLDLSVVRPDFVPISFYKIFGLPTGIGALIAKKKSLATLKRPWFAGGTVKYVSVLTDTHALMDDETAFEDGTVNFLAIPEVAYGLEFIDNVGIDNISAHVSRLTGMMLADMLKLKYNNGAPMLRVYGPQTMHNRGGIIAFDVLTPAGNRVDARNVEEAANKKKISLRTGCFCNPGAAESALKTNIGRTKECVDAMDTAVLSTPLISECVGEFLGTVRASLGIASSKKDVEKFLSFLRKFGSAFQGKTKDCIGNCDVADIDEEIVSMAMQDSRSSHGKHRHSHRSHHKHDVQLFIR